MLLIPVSPLSLLIGGLGSKEEFNVVERSLPTVSETVCFTESTLPEFEEEDDDDFSLSSALRRNRSLLTMARADRDKGVMSILFNDSRSILSNFSTNSCRSFGRGRALENVSAARRPDGSGEREFALWWAVHLDHRESDTRGGLTTLSFRRRRMAFLKTKDIMVESGEETKERRVQSLNLLCCYHSKQSR